MPKGTPSLSQWLSENEEHRACFWLDELTPEVREQIVQSSASTARVVQWLRSIGYDGEQMPEATSQKIDAHRRREREQRARRADAG
jgi:hypothetical protein